MCISFLFAKCFTRNHVQIFLRKVNKKELHVKILCSFDVGPTNADGWVMCQELINNSISKHNIYC